MFAPGGYDLSGARGQVDVVLDFRHGEDLLSIAGFGTGYDTTKEVLAASSVSKGSTFISLVEADGSLFPPVTTIELRGFVGLDTSDFATLAP